MYRKMSACLIAILLACTGLQANSQEDNVVNLGTTVAGNQEQPKVLYIVPWKEARDDTILDQGLDSDMHEVFGHVERSEHIRQIQFLNELDKNTADK